MAARVPGRQRRRPAATGSGPSTASPGAGAACRCSLRCAPSADRFHWRSTRCTAAHRQRWPQQ
ncbi:hypothetical protein TP41_20975 [Xanthomonas euvesicatoria pv. citrumelonis]|nr:hypothetical protein TP41_20975 [Xanthomonas euvesicatoria pv. citrumelonis]